MKNIVFHGSTEHGLGEILPRVSSHDSLWVYATRHKVISAIFLARWNDFHLALGSQTNDDNKVFYLCERYSGAFDRIFSQCSGSIYTLPGDTFQAEMTPWHEEVVSTEPVKVISEKVIDNVAEYIRKLEQEKEIDLYTYPERPDNVPADDSDIIIKSAFWTKKARQENPDCVHTEFLELHPHLGENYHKALKDHTIEELQEIIFKR